MTVTDVLQRLDELRALPLLAHSEKSEIENLYPEVLGKKFVRTSCNDCYRDAIIEMYLYLKKNGAMKEKCSYTLKKGALIQMDFGSGEFYTNANLTDEVAEMYLSKHPDGRVLFASMPDDWYERSANRENGKAEELIEKTITMLEDGKSDDEIKAVLKQETVDGKKLRIRAINAYIEEAKKTLES